MTTNNVQHIDIVNLIDQYYDALAEYAFLDSEEERNKNPYFIEIVNRIMSNDLRDNHQIKTEYYGMLTPYEYVVKMREMLTDSSYDETSSVIHDSRTDTDTDSGWVTIDDDEYDTLRKEEVRMIRDYYDKLVELFTIV
jgi:hypothetical protein